LWYKQVERADAGRPSVERHHPENAKGLSEGGEQFSEVLQQVPGGAGRKRDQGVYGSTTKSDWVSCRNRHCPKCQFLRKEKWIEAKTEDLLPIQYFHVVFTIPAELNPLVLSNQKVMYNLLFRSVSETLLTLSNDLKRLGACIGFTGILHTWGQNVMDYPHIHCIVTGGGLSPDGGHRVSCRKGFFIPIRVMSALFSVCP
jgi:hypothetical protein